MDIDKQVDVPVQVVDRYLESQNLTLILLVAAQPDRSNGKVG